jgi:hypothetical protein
MNKKDLLDLSYKRFKNGNFSKKIIVELIENGLVDDPNEAIFPEISEKDIKDTLRYDDNLNFIGDSMKKDPFLLSIGFKVVEERYFLPIPIYLAYIYKEFNIKNVLNFVNEINDQNDKEFFIKSLKLNKNIRDKSLKVWLKLQ